MEERKHLLYSCLQINTASLVDCFFVFRFGNEGLVTVSCHIEMVKMCDNIYHFNLNRQLLT